MDSCHLFNFLFGTRKATSELRKCFSGGDTNSSQRRAALNKKFAAGQKQTSLSATSNQRNQKQTPETNTAQSSRSSSSSAAAAAASSPLKQIQQKLINLAHGYGSEASILTDGPNSDGRHELAPDDSCRQTKAAQYTANLAYGIFEAQLVRLEGSADDDGANADNHHDAKHDSSQLDENNNEDNNNNYNYNYKVENNRAPDNRVLVANPANQLNDSLDDLLSGETTTSQHRITVYDNPMVGAAAGQDDDDDDGAEEGGEEKEKENRREKCGVTGQAVDAADKRRKFERFKDLVQSFETNCRRESAQSQHQWASLDQQTSLARRGSLKPPRTPPKSTRAKCLNLQLSLRKPTSIAQLFQDEAFLRRHFFDKLAPIDRCAAAQVCRRWRTVLYADKNYWKGLVGVIDCTHLRREQLTDCILNTLQTARLKHQQQHLLKLQCHQLNGLAGGGHQMSNQNSSLTAIVHPSAAHSTSQHHHHPNGVTSSDPNDLGQLDQDEIWRIQELCNRYTMRGGLSGPATTATTTTTSTSTTTTTTMTNRTSSASQIDQNDATATSNTTQQSTSGIATSKSSSSQISSSTLSSISISSLLSPLSESNRVDSIREKLYTAIDERGFDSICLFGASDDDIDDLASKTTPSGAQAQIKLARLSNCSLSDRGLDVFVSAFSQIEELELTGCNEITNSIDLRHLKRLRRLIITDCINIADGLAQRLIEIVHQLEVLVLQAYHLTDAFLEFLSLNADTSRLKRLELPNCKEITNSSALTIAKHFPAVVSLSVSGSTRINDDGIEVLSEHMKSLTSLDLSWLKIGDLSLECLACDLRHLRELILDRNAHITDMGVSYLATMANLTLLYVRWCPQLSDKCIKSISNMHALKRLSLAGLHQITARGILTLIDSQQLEELELTNCPAVTWELQQFLTNKMPNCNIIN